MSAGTGGTTPPCPPRLCTRGDKERFVVSDATARTLHFCSDMVFVTHTWVAFSSPSLDLHCLPHIPHLL